MEEIKIKTEIDIEISDEDIDDIMATALEGGVNYWCDEVKVDGEYLGEYASEQISRGGELHFLLNEPFDNNDTKCYTLDKTKFLHGVKELLDDPGNLRCFLQASAVDAWGINPFMIDADAADEIIQYALFNELVFG